MFITYLILRAGRLRYARARSISDRPSLDNSSNHCGPLVVQGVHALPCYALPVCSLSVSSRRVLLSSSASASPLSIWRASFSLLCLSFSPRSCLYIYLPIDTPVAAMIVPLPCRYLYSYFACLLRYKSHTRLCLCAGPFGRLRFESRRVLDSSRVTRLPALSKPRILKYFALSLAPL